ncbi:acetyltransferase [Candidatus Pelagibacter ubique]|nr:acetyltransferase [Candidatus Pelagibacter ubique]
MSKKLAIIGAGGHGKVVGEIALLNHYKIIDFFDDRANEIKLFPFNIVGNLDYLKDHLKDYDFFFVAIGDNQIRNDKLEWLKKYKVNVISLVHPKSTVSKFSSLGIGACIMANAAVNPGTSIKEGVIINTSASIDHDCIIEKFAHISPNCSLSGSVRIGEFTHLGSGTSVHPEIFIGNKVKTGIGSKVFKNISDETIYKD